MVLFNKQMFADVIDISEGGVLCRVDEHYKDYLVPEFKADFLNKINGKFINDLYGKVVYSRATQSVDLPVNPNSPYWDIGVAFQDVCENHNSELNIFIKEII